MASIRDWALRLHAHRQSLAAIPASIDDGDAEREAVMHFEAQFARALLRSLDPIIADAGHVDIGPVPGFDPHDDYPERQSSLDAMAHALDLAIAERSQAIAIHETISGIGNASIDLVFEKFGSKVLFVVPNEAIRSFLMERLQTSDGLPPLVVGHLAAKRMLGSKDLPAVEALYLAERFPVQDKAIAELAARFRASVPDILIVDEVGCGRTTNGIEHDVSLKRVVGGAVKVETGESPSSPRP